MNVQLNVTNNGNRFLFKGILVAFLVLVMLIPSLFVFNLVEERAKRQDDVVHEVSSKWAGSQVVTGPVLIVPYVEKQLLKDGKEGMVRGTAYILPEELKVTGNISPQEKKRGLYSVTLYRAKVNLAGRFGKMPLKMLNVDPENILWNEAKILLNVDDVRGIDDIVSLDWNTDKLQMEAGVPDNSLFKEGLNSPVSLSADGEYSFSVSLSLKGSEYLYFTPTGKTTTTDITANWKDPSFDGLYLPESSSVNGNSFKAHWKILPLARNFPQAWKDSEQNLKKAAYGVRMIQAVDGYSQTSRSVKYAILFISLTFTFFFFLEILQKRRIHPIQYLLVGIALSVFYTLLLSISEYTGFQLAYFIASLATITLIATYVHSIFKSTATTAGFGVVLGSLYGCIFILIQSEDRALLFGSIGLFAIVAVIMYFSRKVDWYGASASAAVAASAPDTPID